MARTILTPMVLLMESTRLLDWHEKPAGKYFAHLPVNEWLHECLDDYSSEILLPRLKIKSGKTKALDKDEFSFVGVLKRGPYSGEYTVTNNNIFLTIHHRSSL